MSISSLTQHGIKKLLKYIGRHFVEPHVYVVLLSSSYLQKGALPCVFSGQSDLQQFPL